MRLGLRGLWVGEGGPGGWRDEGWVTFAALVCGADENMLDPRCKLSLRVSPNLTLEHMV